MVYVKELLSPIAHERRRGPSDEQVIDGPAGEHAPGAWHFCDPGASSPRSAMRVLVVDPNPALRRVLSLELEEAGYPIIDVESLEDAIRLMREDPPDAIVLNAALTPASSARFIRILRSDSQAVPVVAVAFAAGSERPLLDAGADCCLRRVPEAGDILKAVDWVLSVDGDRRTP